MSGDTTKWREVVEVNLLGLCVATREAVKSMRRHEVDGCVVHVNSLAGHRVTQSIGYMYAPSKFAVSAAAEVLRWEIANAESRIRVSVSFRVGTSDVDYCYCY